MDRIAVETILRSQPQLRRFAEAVLDLIYNEVIVREELGDIPAPKNTSGGSRSLPPPLETSSQSIANSYPFSGLHRTSMGQICAVSTDRRCTGPESGLQPRGW